MKLNSLGGRGVGKKRMPSGNKTDRDGRNTKHVPTRKRADLPEVIQLGILQHETKKGWSVMNRKAVRNDESTDRIRKNPSEIHEDEILHAWMEVQKADTNVQRQDEWID